MIRSLSLLLLAQCAMLVQAQQGTASLPEPEYRDQYTVLTDGRLVPLERETAVTETQSRRNFVITPSVSSFQTLRGPSSPVHVTPATHFFVKLNIGDQDPAMVIHLRKLVPGKEDRRIPFMTIRGSLVPFAGPKHERAADDSVPFTAQKYGVGSLEIIPSAPLAPGEYAFVNANQAQCFGVDAAAAQPLAGGGNVQSQRAIGSVGASAPQTAWQTPPIVHSDPRQEVRSAALPGTVETRGKRYPAQLSISCTITNDPNRPPAVGCLQVNLDLPRPMSALLTGDFSCEGDGASGSPSVYTDIGSKNISARNACFDGDTQTSQESPTISVGLTYEPPLVKSILNAQGKAFAVHIRTEPGGSDNLVARFSLPQQNSTVQGLLDPCINMMNAAREKELAGIVVACPSVDGAVLSDVDVVSGPRSKPVPPDPENDIGTVWNLRPSTRTKEAQPKRFLVCSYRSSSGPLTEKKTLPIPAIAANCVHRTDDYTNDPYGNCTR